MTDIAITIADIRVEQRRDALGIGAARPRLSWIVATTVASWRQSAYAIEAYGSDGQRHDQTGRVESDQSAFVPWPFAPLASRERRIVRVRVWGQGSDGQSITSSPSRPSRRRSHPRPGAAPHALWDSRVRMGDRGWPYDGRGHRPAEHDGARDPRWRRRSADRDRGRNAPLGLRLPEPRGGPSPLSLDSPIAELIADPVAWAVVLPTLLRYMPGLRRLEGNGERTVRDLFAFEPQGSQLLADIKSALAGLRR